jgi:hypothetical protein
VRPLPDSIEVLAFVLGHEVRETTIDRFYPPKVMFRWVRECLRRSIALSLHLAKYIEVGGAHELLPDDVQAVLGMRTKRSLRVLKRPGAQLFIIIVVPVERLTEKVLAMPLALAQSCDVPRGYSLNNGDGVKPRPARESHPRGQGLA